MISNKCFPTLYSYIASQKTNQLLNLLQLLKVWTLESNTNIFVLTKDKVVNILPLFRAVKLILTSFCRNQKQTLKDHLWTFRDLFQFTPCLPIHKGIVTKIPRIRPWRVNIIIIIIIIQIRIAIIGMEIIPSQEVRDMDVDMVPTMLLIFPIHFQHYTFNKHQQMFFPMHCPQQQTLTLLLFLILKHTW